MGFWDVTKRVLQGKPGFEAPKENDPWEDEAPTDAYSEERRAQRQAAANNDPTTLRDERGVKQIPVAQLTNGQTSGFGQNSTVSVTVKNQSARDIQLDKLTLLGTTFQMNYPLGPGAQRVFIAYKGPQPDHDNYAKAELYYRDTLTGDYFRADHGVNYKYDSDGTYEVTGFDLMQPIADV